LGGSLAVRSPGKAADGLGDGKVFPGHPWAWAQLGRSLALGCSSRGTKIEKHAKLHDVDLSYNALVGNAVLRGAEFVGNAAIPEYLAPFAGVSDDETCPGL
jgi:hypothetical protein